MAPDSPLNVLFLCTGNSARSVMAEALMNHLPIARDKFRAFSAGSHPRGTVDPLAIEALTDFDISGEGLRSKSWDEFASPTAPEMHFVFTVCDQAAAEQCPIWPGQPMTAQWSVADPASVTKSQEARRRAFRDAALLLRRRIELFASLPFDKLTQLALQERIDAIGRSNP
jgi:arsenate reductase (thioredoxin)